MPSVTINGRQIDVYRSMPEGTNAGGNVELENIKIAATQGNFYATEKIIQNSGSFGVSSELTADEIRDIERIDLFILADDGFKENFENALLNKVDVSNHLYTMYYQVSQFFEFDKNRTREAMTHFQFSIGESSFLDIKGHTGTIQKWVEDNDITA